MGGEKIKSPRAPSFALDEAIDKALKLYELARTRGISPDDSATQLGYKNANNGAYRTTQATMGYYGLLVKKGSGLIGVPEELQAYKFNPDENQKRAQVLWWLASPKVFADVLEKFPHSIPSDKTLLFNFVSMGFNEQAAEKLVKVFKQSVDFSGFYSKSKIVGGVEVVPGEVGGLEEPNVDGRELENEDATKPDVNDGSQRVDSPMGKQIRTPVRLPGKRIAWLETPIPFYAKDRGRLIAQIELLLCDDEDQ